MPARWPGGPGGAWCQVAAPGGSPRQVGLCAPGGLACQEGQVARRGPKARWDTGQVHARWRSRQVGQVASPARWPHICCRPKFYYQFRWPLPPGGQVAPPARWALPPGGLQAPGGVWKWHLHFIKMLRQVAPCARWARWASSPGAPGGSARWLPGRFQMGSLCMEAQCSACYHRLHTIA